MDNLIYDRLASDVDTALNNPGSTSHLKGSYNYSDLNRVEEWCEYLEEQLKPYGFDEELSIKKNWNIRDYPTRTQIDRVRANIDKLKAFCISINPGTIEYNNTLDYKQANLLERILYEIYVSLIEMNITINSNVNIGATLVRKDYVSLKMNTDIITEILKIDANVNVGMILVKKDFVHLEAKDIPEEYETIKAEFRIGATITKQDFIKLSVNSIEENTTIKSNTNIGATIVSKEFIKLKEVN